MSGLAFAMEACYRVAMRNFLVSLMVCGVAIVIAVLLCTHHVRVGFALFCAALIPVYYIFVRAIREMHHDDD